MAKMEKQPKIIFKKVYHGFEDIYDLGRDVEKMWDKVHDQEINATLDSIPGEFQGKITVLITYEEEDNDES
jgi:hypothetical protein